MAFNWLTPVRGIQLLLALITLGIDGNLISSYGGFTQFNFIIWTCIWTLLTTGFIAAMSVLRPNSSAAQPVIVLVIEWLSWVFWLASFSCIAAVLGYCEGRSIGVCGRFNAVLAFGILEW